MRDFGEYDARGGEVVTRWYKRNWNDPPEAIVGKIAAKLEELVDAHLKAVEKRLAKENPNIKTQT